MSLEPYRNLSGKSGVVAYEIKATSIKLRFCSGEVYRYTHRSAGAVNIARMKQLARAGSGLATFINQVVRDDYDSKEKSPAKTAALEPPAV